MELLDQLFGAFRGPYQLYFCLGSWFVVLAMGYLGAPLILWTITVGILLVGWDAPDAALVIYLVVAVLFNTPLRKFTLSSMVMKAMKAFKLIPAISETERTALEAGVVWIEADLFSGRPNFKKILEKTEYPSMSPEEQKHVDHITDGVCSRVDDWKFWETRELTKEAMDFIKQEKLFGMIIPKEKGGLGLSNLAHSEVVCKVSTHSIALGVFIMVPNSLGPAELLLHYGTEAQKEKYLARLASGEEIPCFALTEPTAGSDAGAISASGEVYKGPDGRLMVRLNWNKRWITLAAISTLLGVAFKMRDPENLLGKGEEVGITCALVPTSTKGVIVGNRHDPLAVPFYNCPTQGENVEVAIEDVVVGGVDGCGKGWGMLMDSLSAGRGISLPSQAAGAGKLCSRVTGAHATNRKQFGLSIGRFEGVEEALARIVGMNYVMESCRKYTAGAIDSGIKPPVVTAIAKYYNTEMMRKVVNDSMDILGGAGITRGPRNVMAHPYISAPIGITVEGANILTRTLMIFGQGALRAHPFAYKEVAAVEKGDLGEFDKAFWGHIGHIIHNTFRAVLLSLTRGQLASTPGGPARGFYKKLAWCSAVFALMSDIAMGSLGGALKTKGKLTGRFADILGWMYLATATLKRFEAEGRKKEDLIVLQYSMTMAFNEIQKAFEGIFQNLKVPGLTWLFAGPINWWTRMNALDRQISDRVSHKVAQLIQQDTEQRDRLTEGIFMGEGARRIDEAFKMVKKAEDIERKLRKAYKAGQLSSKRTSKNMDEALEKGVITKEEYDSIKKATEMRLDAIQVDDFTQQEYLERNGSYGRMTKETGATNTTTTYSATESSAVTPPVGK